MLAKGQKPDVFALREGNLKNFTSKVCMSRNIDRSAVNNSRQGAFNTGRSFATPRGGNNAADDQPGYPTSGGGTAFNEGRSRLASGQEKHYNGGQASIRPGAVYRNGDKDVTPR